MPPKARITREMILSEAVQLIREGGAEQITVRSLANRLNCSTQPVLYHFSSVEEIKSAAYQWADQYHSEYLMRLSTENENPVLMIGMNYIRFAVEEPKLFQFLFQSGELSGTSLGQLMEGEALDPILEVLGQQTGLERKQAREIFTQLFIFVHGYASLLAGNAMIYEEGVIAASLSTVFQGVMAAAREETDEKTV